MRLTREEWNQELSPRPCPKCNAPMPIKRTLDAIIPALLLLGYVAFCIWAAVTP